MDFANRTTFKHCEAPLCNQLDFLPFSCKECGGNFCAEHREWKHHNCTEGLKKLQGRIAKECPDCGVVVSQLQGKTYAETLELHKSAGYCLTLKQLEKSNKKKKNKKKRYRCSAKGCKESVKQSYQQFKCNNCQLKFCVKHRTPQLHNCKNLKPSYLATLAADWRAMFRRNPKAEVAAERKHHYGPPPVKAF